jgi:hypothetical protein
MLSFAETARDSLVFQFILHLVIVVLVKFLEKSVITLTFGFANHSYVWIGGQPEVHILTDAGRTWIWSRGVISSSSKLGPSLPLAELNG